MARPVTIKDSEIVRLRISGAHYLMLKDLAGLETAYRQKLCSIQDLIRMAVEFTFDSNERLRECFTRSRRLTSMRYPKSMV